MFFEDVVFLFHIQSVKTLSLHDFFSRKRRTIEYLQHW